MGTQIPIVIPANGYMGIFLSDASQFAEDDGSGAGDVYFDLLQVRFSRGNLKEENHYYPFGMPMGDISGTAAGFVPNRHRYQGNEYVKDLGVNWMDFQARQYDPQIGRFLGVDPLADDSGQEQFSPYSAMGNNPGMMVDPGGMKWQGWSSRGSDAPQVPLMPAGFFASSFTSNGDYMMQFLKLQMDVSGEEAWKDNYEDFLAMAFVNTMGLENGGGAGGGGDFSGYIDIANEVTASYNKMKEEKGNEIANTPAANFNGYVDIPDIGPTSSYAWYKPPPVKKKRVYFNFSLGLEQLGNIGTGLSTTGYFMSKGFPIVSKYLGDAGNIFSGVGLLYNVYQYENNEISGTRLAYNTTGFLSGYVAGRFISSPAGMGVAGAFMYADGLYTLGNYIWTGFENSYNQWSSNYIYGLTH